MTIKIGDLVRVIAKRGRAAAVRPLGRVVELNDDRARIQPGKSPFTTVWPVKRLEVFDPESIPACTCGGSLSPSGECDGGA